MASSPRFGFVVEYVADLDAARRFFVEVLGLTVEREHPTFVEFVDPAGVHCAIASDEPLEPGNQRELYWLVADAEAAYRELAPRALIRVPLKTMPYGKVFGIQDPAGQAHYWLELAANRPSRPV
ncbi:MAG TPA: VOC family protein [Chloroflexota bacterium]|jgi:catechol 2,3-dioxygenase-like lactoylglutathione lyase family enzyme|nr:VOC family protein [Chloroflexota bacterium]